MRKKKDRPISCKNKDVKIVNKISASAKPMTLMVKYYFQKNQENIRICAFSTYHTQYIAAFSQYNLKNERNHVQIRRGEEAGTS